MRRHVDSGNIEYAASLNAQTISTAIQRIRQGIGDQTDMAIVKGRSKAIPSESVLLSPRAAIIHRCSTISASDAVEIYSLD